jgi:hypothetical protein
MEENTETETETEKGKTEENTKEHGSLTDFK